MPPVLEAEIVAVPAGRFSNSGTDKAQGTETDTLVGHLQNSL